MRGGSAPARAPGDDLRLFASTSAPTLTSAVAASAAITRCLIRIIFAPLFVSWMTIGLSCRMSEHPTGARLRLPGYMGVTGNGQIFDGDGCSGASGMCAN